MNPAGVDGYPTPVVLGGAESVLWWMPGDPDLVATSDKRLVVWPDVEQAFAAAHALGWRAAVTADEVDAPVDADHVVRWVHGRTLRLDPRQALGVWNLADDVSASLGLARAKGGRVAAGCHTKLTASAVPWAFGRERYDPRWTPRELAVLRPTLDQCVAVLRHAIRAAGARP